MKKSNTRKEVGMEIPSEKEIAKDCLKNIYEDRERRRDLLTAMPEGENKKIVKEMEKAMQAEEKNSIKMLKEILRGK